MKTRTILFGAFLLAVAGCQGGGCAPTADQVIQSKQEKQQAEAAREVGLPNITRFTEMKRVRYLYELRDRANLTCWIYTRDWQGKMHLIGVGMGFPVPYGTEFSNPQKLVDTGTSHVMPQAEPNGLFPPTTAEATWVILMTKNGPKPYYAETRLEGSPLRLPNADETQTIWPDGKPLPLDVAEPPTADEKDVKAVEPGNKE